MLLAAFGGLRRGELFGLTRGDVNLLHRTVSVRVQRQESRRGEILLGPPKTAAGRRTLVLPAELLPELRPHLRDELPPDDAVVVVRGGPTTIERLAVHVDRTHDAFSLDGQPLWGVSVFCALDETGSGSVDGLLERFSSYRVVHLPRVGQIRAARFELLPSFGRPHYTLRLMTADGPELARLIAALGPAEANPYHGGKRPGRR